MMNMMMMLIMIMLMMAMIMMMIMVIIINEHDDVQVNLNELDQQMEAIKEMFVKKQEMMKKMSCVEVSLLKSLFLILFNKIINNFWLLTSPSCKLPRLLSTWWSKKCSEIVFWHLLLYLRLSCIWTNVLSCTSKNS